MDKTLENVESIITQREISFPLGIILERRESKHPWGDWIWKPVAVLPGAAPVSDWVVLASGEDWIHFQIATLPLVLHRKETEALKLNIESDAPHLYVVLRENDDEGGHPFIAHLVTASPYDAQDYLDTSEELIEKVPMPPAIFEWIKAFIAEHHKEEEFKKRKRDKINVEDHKFGKEPIFVTNARYPS